MARTGRRTGMRVLHVIAGAKGGVAEGIMLDAVAALAEAGVTQHVVTRGHSKARLATLESARVSYDTANFDKDSREPTRNAIREAADTFAPDVIHYWMGRAASFAPKQYREISVGWYGGSSKIERFRNCAWHAAATECAVREIVDKGAPEDRVSVLHGYVKLPPAPAAKRGSLDTPEDAQAVLALTRLDWESGVDVLLDAVKQLTGVYAWIAGAGPLEAQLKQQAKKLDIEKRVRFLGARSDDAGLLAACDAVVSPARHDAFGLAALEAWAAKRPLVTTDAYGPASMVTHDVDALLVARDDANALASALRRVLDDGDLSNALAIAGARAYRAGFTKTAFVRVAMTLYDRVRRSHEQHRRAPAA